MIGQAGPEYGIISNRKKRILEAGFIREVFPMYQIFVVEDELLIRQSIRHTIENMKGPYAFCGEASDGEMALSMMQDLMPDILLTDIRMPFLDGFGLIRHAKAMMPWLRIAIISGFGDFEFAQKAIALGVDQYLLKPVRPAELTRVVEELASRIEKSKSAVPAASSFGPEEINKALRQHFMRQLLFGGVDTGTLLEQARTLHMDIIRAYYLTTVCYFDAQNLDLTRIRNTVQRILAEEEDTLYDFTAGDQMTLLCYGNDVEALNERTYRMVNILRHELKDQCPVITAVIGSAVERLVAIPDAYKTAANLLQKVSGVSVGQVINVSDTAQITADIVQFNGLFSQDFQQRVQCVTPQEVPALLDETLSGPEGAQFDSMLMRYYALIDILKIAVHIIARSTPGTNSKDIAARLSERYDVFAASGNRKAFRETAEGLLCAALSARQDAQNEMKYSHVISRAEKYVAENYCDPNISLISVARHVGMSAAHFSTVFSQTMGRSFINYLTAMRLEKAKQLLTATNMKLSDIALEIGYNEPNYFSHVFRKTEGITPKEYRNRDQSGR